MSPPASASRNFAGSVSRPLSSSLGVWVPRNTAPTSRTGPASTRTRPRSSLSPHLSPPYPTFHHSQRGSRRKTGRPHAVFAGQRRGARVGSSGGEAVGAGRSPPPGSRSTGVSWNDPADFRHLTRLRGGAKWGYRLDTQRRTEL